MWIRFAKEEWKRRGKMIKQYLHGNWKMKRTDEQEYLEATVPGSVYSDLLRNNRMKDPYYRDNETDALKLIGKDFEYCTGFDVSRELLDCDRVLLRCEGLDTVAQLYLNGSFIGDVQNMHRTWEFDVKEHLQEKDNVLKIIFYSPTEFIRNEYEKCISNGSEDAMKGFTHIRKAHCMFGWDWGPRLPDAGIWRDILLCGIRCARLEEVYITQEHHGDFVNLKLSVKSEATDGSGGNAGNFPYTVLLTSPDGTVRTYENSPQEIKVESPELWWPNGYGGQPLYTVEVVLKESGAILDTWKRRIGLRTMTMHREKDQYGESFAHEVNGIQIFAMGADYIPEDNILSRMNADRTRKLLKQCADANFNVIRVWGGGFYPADYFYDICDELGLIVWQDFMFACGVYELSEAFEDNIVNEFRDNIRRIRHHASLGLWCGNNEMELFVDKGVWVTRPKQKADYIKMYEYLIPRSLKQYDPNTFYWPASPSSGGSFDDPNDESRGDVHYWDVWHGDKPFPEYRKHCFRYVSEFGFQAFPSLKTVEAFTEPEDRNIFSYVMEKHQRNNAANGKIMNYLSRTFLYPTEFGTLLYASQMLQAEAIKYGVEHFRRNRGICMGAVYWQLNDCWPVASWSSIDYYGRWKALHYYARRFFAPVLLSCCEEGLLTQDPNVNAESYAVKKSIRLNVSNETRADKRVTVRWALRNRYAEVRREGEAALEVPALSAVWLEEIEFPDAELYRDYVSYELLEGGETVSSGTVIFSVPKHFKFADPGLRYRMEQDEIILTAGAYAKGVEILNDSEDMILSDNYFDMNAGEKRVRILSGQPDRIKIRSVYDIK
jgi:beta-mannosidase